MVIGTIRKKWYICILMYITYLDSNMPYLESNIPSKIFYSFLGAMSKLLLLFYSTSAELVSEIVCQSVCLLVRIFDQLFFKNDWIFFCDTLQEVLIFAKLSLSPREEDILGYFLPSLVHLVFFYVPLFLENRSIFFHEILYRYSLGLSLYFFDWPKSFSFENTRTLTKPFRNN